MSLPMHKLGVEISIPNTNYDITRSTREVLQAVESWLCWERVDCICFILVHQNSLAMLLYMKNFFIHYYSTTVIKNKMYAIYVYM